MSFPYRLASNKLPKLDCPYCGAKKHWQRYYSIETNEALKDEYGRCDNESKCGQWNKPNFKNENDLNKLQIRTTKRYTRGCKLNSV